MEPPADIPAAEASPPARNSWTLLLVLMIALTATSVALVQFRQEPQRQGAESAVGWSPAADPQADSVALEIDFGNGARREFAALPWAPGMTVAEVLKQASHFHPGIAFTQQGSGEGAFLTSLDEVTGDATIGRFWIYAINGKSGEVSFELAPVAKGDRVLWAFKQPE